MREIVIDTETTGFDALNGDRVVEIGCIELLNHIPTGNEYQVYINPERDMPSGAFEVHGLSETFLSDKPLFADIVDDFDSFDHPLQFFLGLNGADVFCQILIFDLDHRKDTAFDILVVSLVGEVDFTGQRISARRWRHCFGEGTCPGCRGDSGGHLYWWWGLARFVS